MCMFVSYLILWQVARSALSPEDYSLLMQATSSIPTCLSNRYLEMVSGGADVVIDPWLFAAFVYMTSPDSRVAFTVEALELIQKLVECRILKVLRHVKAIARYGSELCPGAREWRTLQKMGLVPHKHRHVDALLSPEPDPSTANSTPASGDMFPQFALPAPPRNVPANPSGGGLFGRPFATTFASADGQAVPATGLFGRHTGPLAQAQSQFSDRSPIESGNPTGQNVTATSDGYSSDGSL